MNSKRIGVVAGLVGILGVAIQSAPAIILGRWIDRGFEGTLPMIGSIGQTVTIYNDIGGFVGPLATLSMAVGLGWYVARRVNIATEYRRVGGALAIGSTLGVLIGGAPILFGIPETPSMTLTTGLILAAAGLRMLVEVALLTTIGAIAGAALVTFRTDERPGTPTDADTSTSASPPESEQEDSYPEFRPAH